MSINLTFIMESSKIHLVFLQFQQFGNDESPLKRDMLHSRQRAHRTVIFNDEELVSVEDKGNPQMRSPLPFAFHVIRPQCIVN